MAKCTRCGNNLGMLESLQSSVCKNCKTEIANEQARQKAALQEQQRQEQIRAREEAARKRQQKITERANALCHRVARGEKVFLYDTIYLPVDSIVLDETLADGIDIKHIMAMGLYGWEVIQVIPRTFGAGLTNKSSGSSNGTSWGGGTGGNVIGVHIILKKELLPTEDQIILVNELTEYVAEHIM